ncbi:DEP domain-containing protein 1B isoform X1 [Mirounga angustirostris]|uniref:DEP domain-containing protein 1B isoform X1 n=1 Tax=Mirounga leonina TaxID=9715 RepID=UPI00156C2FB0|nr:DEP domain-containing protein 1B isoform X1 [Mirounga leonina]XP_045751239.1 DEP domain-containing protein 1B isoform X1 [Mirounga angustirostris]
MEHRIVGPGPYRATKLWNETVELFRARMPLRKHRCRFKSYDRCFTAAEAVDWLHELLRCSQNFGPEVTRKQTVQLLKKFLKNHVIEDIKGKWGQEDFEDNRHLYRFPPSSPLKPYPKKPTYQKDVIKFPEWNDPPPSTSQENIPVRPVVMTSEMWYKRHSIAIGEVPACRLVCRRQLTEANVEEIWKSMTLAYLQKVLGLDSLEEVLDIKLVNSKFIIHNVYSVSKQGVVILDDKSKELPHWVLSAMKCLANWPNCSDLKQPMYLGFEKDVFKTIADYYGHLKEPLLTFHLFDAFVSVLGLLQKEKMAIEAFQICCLLLPPENRRKLQLLMRMMARICLNKEMPPLCDGFGTRTLMVQTFSRCILCSKDEVDLDELLAARLVTFLMDNYQEILKVPLALQTSIEERVAHLRRVQIKYPGADMDITLSAPSFCRQISPEEFEYQRAYGSQEPLAALLEEVITDATLSSKEKKKKLKQFQKSYPEVYQERFPTPESEALLFPEKPKPKPQLLMWALKNPFQPFQRTRSFRM